jgi:hypothetical protein
MRSGSHHFLSLRAGVGILVAEDLKEIVLQAQRILISVLMCYHLQQGVWGLFIS